MGIQQDIADVFEKILEEEGGNRASAARRLDTNPVTFWGWIEGDRGKKGRNALWNALDLAGARLIAANQTKYTSDPIGMVQKIELLEAENSRLNKENDKLKAQLEFAKELLDAARTGGTKNETIFSEETGQTGAA